MDAGVSLDSFLWSQLAPTLATMAGNCSYFVSTANSFSGNHANVAGAVIYSTNVTSMQLSCSASLEFQDPGKDCPAWSSSSFPANTVGAEGTIGYGPGLAFPPAGIALGGSSTIAQQLSYISDGSTKIPMPEVSVLDQAGNTVRMQPLLANVTVDTISNLTAGTASPQLPGQTQASGDANGTIEMSGVILIAAPGQYDLLIALTSFPEVTPVLRD